MNVGSLRRKDVRFTIKPNREEKEEHSLKWSEWGG
jgi:hypothetical protein